MKLLRNPVVVGVLAVVAVVVVFMQFAPLMRSGSANPASSTATSVDPSVQAPAAISNPVRVLTNVAAEPSMDLAALEIQAARWSDATDKDPFRLKKKTNVAQPAPKASFPPARDLLLLSAVWRQTKGDLAVVNGRVMTLGDEILGFKITGIESDRIWVDGPNGREQVLFGGNSSKLVSPTNRPPTTAGAQNIKHRP